MKKLRYVFASLLVIFFALPQLRSQETKNKEEKKMTVMMIKEDEGSMTSFDTTINLDEDFDHEALTRKLKEKYGIDMQMDAEDGCHFNWTTETGDSGAVKKIRKLMGENSYIMISSDDEIEFKPDGDSKVFSFTKKIELNDDGEYKVILKKSPDDVSERKMIWYELEEEEFDGKRKILLKADKCEGNSKVIVKKMFVEKDEDAKIDVWVDADKHQKVNFNSAGSDSFVFEQGIRVKITDPDASELSAAGVKTRDKGLMVKNLELILKGEDAELSFYLSTSGKTSIKLLNSVGQKILADKVKYFPGTYRKLLGLLPHEGEYFLQITQGDSDFIKKIKITK